MRHAPVVLALALALALPATARADESDLVPVRMKGGKELVLERMIEGTSLWESLCVGECNARVPWNGWYRVTGHGIRPSMPIGLVTARDGAVHLEPHPAYSSGFLGGVVMTAIGPLVFFGGAIAIAVYSPPSGNTPCFGSPCTGGSETLPTPGQAPYIGGTVSMVVGGMMTIAGALIATISHHTKTSQIAFSGRSVTLTF